MQHYNANKKKPKTNNQNKNIETTLPPYLNHTLPSMWAYNRKRKGKIREGKGKTKENNLTRLGAKCIQAIRPRNN